MEAVQVEEDMADREEEVIAEQEGVAQAKERNVQREEHGEGEGKGKHTTLRRRLAMMGVGYRERGGGLWNEEEQEKD